MYIWINVGKRNDDGYLGMSFSLLILFLFIFFIVSVHYHHNQKTTFLLWKKVYSLNECIKHIIRQEMYGFGSMSDSLVDFVLGDGGAGPRQRTKTAFLPWGIHAPAVWRGWAELCLLGTFRGFNFRVSVTTFESGKSLIVRKDRAEFQWCVRSLPRLHLGVPGWGGRRAFGQGVDVSYWKCCPVNGLLYQS